jgi:RNA polymerase sigma factor (sigma-70 family)
MPPSNQIMALSPQQRTQWLANNVLPHEPLIRARLARVYVADLDVDDVIQEMYARILSAPALETIHHPRQYAIQTAKGIIIDHLRRSRVVSIVSGESLEQLDAVLPEGSAEERLEFRGEIQQVANALAHLPETYRETLILRRVEGLSQRETAQRLGITEKMAEYYLARGVMELIKLFGRGGKPRVRSSNTEAVEVTHDNGIAERRD